MKLRQRTLVYLAAALMVAACVSTVDAQGRRGGQGGQGGRGGGAQGGQGGRGGFQPGGFGRNTELTMLGRADVRKELELVPDQIKDLEALIPDYRSLMSNQDMSREDRMAKFQELRAEAEKAPAKINDILLPHQATRLKQLSMQFSMQRGGVTSGTVAEELGISDEQRDELREKARALRLEMEKKMQAELLKELTPTQQAKLKKLIGKPFTFEQTAPQVGGGRAPGGAGAGRGRRGN